MNSQKHAVQNMKNFLNISDFPRYGSLNRGLTFELHDVMKISKFKG